MICESIRFDIDVSIQKAQIGSYLCYDVYNTIIELQASNLLLGSEPVKLAIIVISACADSRVFVWERFTCEKTGFYSLERANNSKFNCKDREEKIIEAINLKN